MNTFKNVPSRYEHIEIDQGDVVIIKRNDGSATFCRKDKTIEVTRVELIKLLSLNDTISKCLDGDIRMHELLGTDKYEGNFVSVESYNGFMYVDIRRWYWGHDKYLPTRIGIKLRSYQWDEVFNGLSKQFRNELFNSILGGQCEESHLTSRDVVV